jgi:hypothetical protein
MFYIILLSVGCAIWAVDPNMGWPAMASLVVIQVGAIVLTSIVSRSHLKDEELHTLRGDLREAQAQLAGLSLDERFDGKIIVANKRSLVSRLFQ